MEKSQLVAVLRSCSKKELKDISRWLRSPAHNLRADAAELFEHLAGHLLDGSPLEKEAIWAVVWPSNGPFDDARMRQTMHFLLKSVEDFLVYQELEKDEARRIQALATVYRRRQLEKPFRQSMEAARRAQTTAPWRNSVHLQHAFTLEMEEYKHLTTLKGNTKFNLQEVSDALDVAFVAQKLWISCLMLTGQAVYKAQYDTGLLESVLTFVESRRLVDRNPSIAAYYYCLKTITSKGDEHIYEVFEAALIEHQPLFPPSEQRVMLLAALNFCIARANAGEARFISKAFELYKRGFEQKILLEDGRLSPRAFKNAVSLSLKLKEYDWAASFIEKNAQLLEEKFRKSAVHFTRSRLFFEQGDYDKALEMLLGYEHDDILWNLDAKVLLLKIYFERGYFEALESHLDAMRAYLYRKEVVGYHRANYANILSLVRKIFHSSPRGVAQKAKLRADIETTNPLTERDWLLAQLDRRR